MYIKGREGGVPFGGEVPSDTRKRANLKLEKPRKQSVSSAKTRKSKNRYLHLRDFRGGKIRTIFAKVRRDLQKLDDVRNNSSVLNKGH
jgi:hypothetical protein